MTLSPLQEVLSLSRARGFLGPGPVDGHIDHGRAMAEVVGECSDLIDLGSGGGVPALVLLACFRMSTGVLVESQVRRSGFLLEVVSELGWSDRVSVRQERAEVSGRVPELRESGGLVTARSFGPPAVLAECAAPLLRLGGRLVVSEPPEVEPGRWDARGLASVGLVLDRIEARGGGHFAVIVKESLVSDRFPRRTGIPAKRPIWQ